ncbi:MAG: PilZ domain-containing protein [Candidatus Marinimicrobia bacterium]|nr:PilZ domain-containing protein [Candidatus Neomarinimicrobiota bacterium]
MVQGFEKRTCHRFEIPNASLMYKRIGFFFPKKYENSIRLYNISKGGLSFACDEEIKKGKTIIVKLFIPNEESLELLAKVCWQRDSSDGYSLATGVAYLPFGKGYNMNPPESLNRLRELDKKYVKNR